MFSCAHSNLYTPLINQLPVELLSHIFVLGTHAVNEDSNGQECLPFNSESVETPLILSSVSRHWRDIALTTPALWTSLCITAELANSEADHDTASFAFKGLKTGRLMTYIQRSRNYPLDILIDARDEEWDFSEPE